MDMSLSNKRPDLRDEALEFCGQVLLPHETEVEEDGGQRYSCFEQMLINERLGRASAAKLYCSEMAGRVVDKALQILGGRGYMRENPVERLYRDLRVDRIWEGTSEIQRAIIGGQIKKRGLGVYTDW